MTHDKIKKRIVAQVTKGKSILDNYKRLAKQGVGSAGQKYDRGEVLMKKLEREGNKFLDALEKL